MGLRRGVLKPCISLPADHRIIDRNCRSQVTTWLDAFP